MTATFDEFRSAASRVSPRVVVVLGSGLGAVADAFTPVETVGFAEIPGLSAATVAGHRGQVAVGHWAGVPAIVCFGRVHLYEGHPLDRVTRLISLAAELGVRTCILTNAAGGIHPKLEPGTLMAIRGHIKIVGSNAWIDIAQDETGRGVVSGPYSLRLLEVMQTHESANDRELVVGVYSAVTGPTYETPAETRFLQAIGADAAGMSTAIEAEAALRLGLEVAAISCITNRAAGLSDGTLSHAEVEETARTAIGRLATLLAKMVQSTV